MKKLGTELGCNIMTHIDYTGDFLFRICVDNICCVSEHYFRIYEFTGKNIEFTANRPVKEKTSDSLDYTITEHDFRMAVVSLINAKKEYNEYIKLKNIEEDFL